jgi:hypothetical protein
MASFTAYQLAERHEVYLCDKSARLRVCATQNPSQSNGGSCLNARSSLY